MSDIKADKEGSINVFLKKKWKTKYAVLTGGCTTLSSLSIMIILFYISA